MVRRAGWLQDAGTETKGSLTAAQLSSTRPATGPMAQLLLSHPPPPPGRHVKKAVYYCTPGFAPASIWLAERERESENMYVYVWYSMYGVCA
ncbi:hypothetical protein LZ31DRAFT_292911 [Colletotrichum somersetense]|nr:hypothetical protein LZ31DRAFT_292911 [Colletotrichum somersetense]